MLSCRHEQRQHAAAGNAGGDQLQGDVHERGAGGFHVAEVDVVGAHVFAEVVGQPLEGREPLPVFAAVRE